MLKLAAGAVWSTEAMSRIVAVAESCSADIVHVHNLFPNLSPTVLRTSWPSVMTLHNFRLACLSANFLRNERICEDCLGRTPWRGVVHGCYRGSRAQSAVIATSLSLHRRLQTFQRVSEYVAVSSFVKERLIEAGLPRARVAVRHNFSWPIVPRGGPGSYFLALGRLSPEKGLRFVVEGWRSRFPLVVIGDGPDRRRLEENAAPRVEFRGVVNATAVPDVLRGARALLVPSVCYEGSPRAIVEALAAGVPVVANDIGGLPEHVEHGVSGLLVQLENGDAWTEAVERLEDDQESEELGAGAYAAWEEHFSPEAGLRSLEAIYAEAIKRANAA